MNNVSRRVNNVSRRVNNVSRWNVILSLSKDGHASRAGFSRAVAGV